jgi:hypothetical protein
MIYGLALITESTSQGPMALDTRMVTMVDCHSKDRFRISKKRRITMSMKHILNLNQTKLYEYAIEHHLSFLKEMKNEREIFRLLEDRLKSQSLEERFVEVLQFIVLYKEYKTVKSHHKATRNRHDNAIELAQWMVENWHEDEEDRKNMLIQLTMASTDIKIKSAMIAMSHYEAFQAFISKNKVDDDISEEEELYE